MELSQDELNNMTPEQLAELQRQQCVFCKIVKGELPSKKIYDDADSLAILDINPANQGHVLLLPKEHYAIMPQLPEELTAHLAMVSKALSQATLKALKSQGTTIFIANGIAAGQKAPHFMIHIIPRFEKDGLNMQIPEGRATKNIAQIAGLVRNKLSSDSTSQKPQATSQQLQAGKKPQAKNKTPEKKGRKDELDKITRMFGNGKL